MAAGHGYTPSLRSKEPNPPSGHQSLATNAFKKAERTGLEPSYHYN